MEGGGGGGGAAAVGGCDGGGAPAGYPMRKNKIKRVS